MTDDETFSLFPIPGPFIPPLYEMMRARSFAKIRRVGGRPEYAAARRTTFICN
jgi:hypothetical protein